MGKKYFETKTGSLEDVSTKIAKEQPTITKPELNVRLERKTYFDNKPGSLEDAAAKVVSEGLDPVNKVAVKKKFDDRKDKDIDNDGDVDSTDKYLHKRRKAISKSMKEDKFEVTGEVDYFEAPNPKDFEVTVSAKDAAEAKQKVMDKYEKGKRRVSSVGISSVQKVNEDLGKEDESKVKKIIGKLKKASDAHAGQAKDLQKAMTEDDMAKFHKMQKDGKSAEQIAKALDIDVKSTKKLMDSYVGVNVDDKGEVINTKKDGNKDPKRGEKALVDPEPKIKDVIKGEKENTRANGFQTKKKFSEMRMKLGNKGKTDTGKDAPTIDTEPKAERI